MNGGTNRLLRLAFRGGAYGGFQVQKNAPTVCEALQDAMQAVLGARPRVKGCSRTDAGVHARGYCLSFVCAANIPDGKLPLALNQSLPRDIRVLACRAVPPAFHARYSARGKRYSYTILNGAVDDVFAQGFYHRVTQPIDDGAMRAAAKYLEGMHDFSSFMAAGGGQKGGAVRTVSGLSVQRDGPWVRIEAEADGFLYRMVRIIAGTLLCAGLARISPEDAGRILAARSRAAAGPTLPAQGLVLEEVFYPDAAFDLNSRLPKSKDGF